MIAVLLVGLFLTGAELEYASKLRGVFRSVRVENAGVTAVQGNLNAALGQGRAQGWHAAFVLHGRDTEATFTRNYIVCRDRTPGVFELWVRAAFVCLPSPTSLFSTPSVRSDICDGGNPKRAKLDGDSSTVGDDYPLLHIRIDGQRRLRVPGVRPRVHRSGDARIAQADPPILAGRLPLNPSSTFPSLTVQLTFPRTDAEGLIFSVELRRIDDAHSGDIAFLECPRIGPFLKVDLWYDDHLPEDEVYLQDEKHPMHKGRECLRCKAKTI